MARIQQSIDIGVPVHVVYQQLMQFEDYPRFMQDVETVHQLDNTHLHWSAKMSYQPLEWDSEIVEQIPDRCIAWRNEGGPMQSGKVELQPVGDSQARLTMTVECDPALVPAERSGNPEQMVAMRIEDDLARFKQFMEERDADVQQQQATQSPASLSQAGQDEDDGRYSIAEEQNFDQQSDQARRVGQMPLDFDPPG
ncbi:SRPBCC family protein [Noviherbaspirillum denitrificans]|uniref:Coenzyme Q-binding protein COQ10 START domain-containing protein n=1 Tax=Noviherbaspirillum denitrificans TaxID=1968433 RepID=A0A254THJ6_9BURK|nr:SRPBCC family protein [Noviherbaspirillum denitrificans]OWW22116.1 hypothetical protein AYR66_24090 [Noviherbaspirillum denitrificans]